MVATDNSSNNTMDISLIKQGIAFDSSIMVAMHRMLTDSKATAAVHIAKIGQAKGLID